MEKIISIYELFKKSQIEQILLFDVRTKDKFNEYHIDGSISAPGFSLVKQTNNFLNKNDKCFIIDYNNEISLEISSYLNDLGYDTTAVFGGIKHWKGKII